MAKKNKQPGTRVSYKQQNRQKEKQLQQQNKQKQALQNCASGELNIQLHPIDTWFFRESRPHDAAGASELSSLFPPPVRTLAGALRTYLGDRVDIDWTTLTCSDSRFDFEKSLGNAEHLGELQLKGPWVCKQGQRLYPAPLYLMHKETRIKRLQIGQPVQCDLGTVRLPEMPADCQGYKAMEQHWLTAAGLRACLEGSTPNTTDIVKTEILFSHEARLGIARDNAQRKVQDGKLYQTQHIRLQDGVHIELDAAKLEQTLYAAIPENEQVILRLGGEGRMASVQAQKQREPLPFTNPKKADRLILHFITPADFAGQMFPAGFKQLEQQGQTVWQGDINGVQLTIEAAVIGKAHREGGWDMKNHQPRAVKSYQPAGSAWYCRLTESTDWSTLETALQGQCIGNETAYGRGQIVIGQWKEQ